MSRPQAILLLSAGLDSSVAAWLLRPQIEPVLALTVNYGQKAAAKECAGAYAMAQRLGIPHRTIFLPWLREVSKGALCDPDQAPPRLQQADLDDVTGAAAASAAAVWIPNRNGCLIALAAAWAEARGAQHVVCGFNREEAATFPDNSQAFLDATNQALALSTQNGVSVVSPTCAMDKQEIVRAGSRAGVPFELCWPCYLGGAEPCGACESCLRFERALQAAGVPLQRRP